MNLDLSLRNTPEGCILPVRVHPGARKNEITGVHDGALKISLTAPPTDGRANEALIAFLAKFLKVQRARITLVTGVTGRSKTLCVIAKSAAEVQASLFGFL